MTDLVLVNPPFIFWKEDLQGIRASTDATPALGLYTLAAVARQAGLTVSVLEMPYRQMGYEDAVEWILRQEPRWVGLSAATIAIYNAAKIADLLKARRPDLPVIIGGPHVTAVPEDTMRRFPQFDLGMVGEAEDTLLPALDALEGGRPLSEVGGALYRANGIVQKNPRAKPIVDMDRIPLPAWDLLPNFPHGYSAPVFNFRRLPVAAMVTSRGCPFTCTFCDTAVFGQRVRGFSADYVLEAVDQLVRRYGVRHVLFFDDLFPALRSRCIEICEKLIAAGSPVSWSCNARVTSMTPDLAKLMARAGCWQMAFGIESGSQRILDLIDKRTTIEAIENAVRWTKAAGIRVKGLFILGHPSETREEMESTLQFAMRLKLDLFQITKFTPLPGSPIYPRARDYGEFEDDWTRMNAMNFLFVTRGFTREQLDNIYWDVNRRFYRRPSQIWSLFKFFAAHPENGWTVAKAVGSYLKARWQYGADVHVRPVGHDQWSHAVV